MTLKELGIGQSARIVYNYAVADFKSFDKKSYATPSLVAQ